MSSLSKSSTDDLEKFLLDRASEVACLAKGGGGKVVDKTQVNNLLTSMQNFKNVEKLELLIMRQMGRGEINQGAGKRLIETIEEIKKRGVNDVVERVLDFLGYVKWAFESMEKMEACSGVNNLSSLVDKVIKGGEPQHRNFQGPKNR
ncbi:hypothetical protein [Metallosphaera hakonensis]|nr:hypothetical protein [Metallosphaera hakonensis]AWR98659.2 hypothetical protein DFR87_01905 [Metallosphaera hakonensis JCM 8857 = DSM 7519]